MPRAIPIVLLLAALAALGGCGGSDDGASDGASSAPAPASTTPAAPAATTTTPARGTASRGKFVVVSALLGRTLPQEPGCRFAKSFTPDTPSVSAYDGALTLTIRCRPADDYTPVGQIVNRRGSKPTEIVCRETTPPQLYCIYVPSPYVGLYFTGTNKAVVRRRLEHLIDVVQPLPTGVTPLSGASSR